MHWEDLPEVMDDWAARARPVARAVKEATCCVFTRSHVGYYYHPELEKVALFAPAASPADAARCKSALQRAVDRINDRPLFLSYCEKVSSSLESPACSPQSKGCRAPTCVKIAQTRYQDLNDPHGQWVKVAYSPVLRGLGEALNFFPGQYTGGIPNHPSPVAAMLTSGLLGAGLGWTGGKLLHALLPNHFGGNLSRTGMVLGGALGAVPGALWGANNKAVGKPFNDSSALSGAAGEEPASYPNAALGSGMTLGRDPAAELNDTARDYLRHTAMTDIKAAMDRVELGTRYKTAVDHLLKRADTFGLSDRRAHSEIDVNIDHLGRTLWDTGAPPQLAATTMGAMYAAQQMPDPNSRPNYVTGNQLGQLARNAAGDYAKGLLVGAAVNKIIGTPYRASSIATGNVALGALGVVIPKLFGG